MNRSLTGWGQMRHANALWAASGGSSGWEECGAPSLGSERIRPAEQVRAHVGEQEAVGRDPANGLEHVERAADHVTIGGRGCQCRQRKGECWGLFQKAANPELSALIGHGALLGRQRGFCQGQVLEEAGHQKQGDDGDAEAHPGEDKVGEKRNRAFAGAAEIAAHEDDAFEGGIYQCPTIKTVTPERLFAWALWAMVRTIEVGVGDRVQVLLDRAVEWV